MNKVPQLMRLPEVLAAVRLSKPGVYRMVKDGRFPAPLKLGRASAWRADEVAAWVESLSTPSK